MRDFRDAKTMAQSLRKALAADSVTVTHSRSLELVAQAFGLENWNTLLAKIEAEQAMPPPSAPAAKGSALYCSFCGKSQHEVQRLIAGPDAFICDACVGLCDGIILDGKLGSLVKQAQARDPGADALVVVADALQTYSDDQLIAFRRSEADWLEHIVWGLGQIASHLGASGSGEPWRPDEIAERRGWTRDPLAGKSSDEISAQRAHLETIEVQVRERIQLLDRLVSERGLSAT